VTHSTATSDPTTTNEWKLNHCLKEGLDRTPYHHQGRRIARLRSADERMSPQPLPHPFLHFGIACASFAINGVLCDHGRCDVTTTPTGLDEYCNDKRTTWLVIGSCVVGETGVGVVEVRPCDG
jgi:hypothetical protein